MLSKLKLFNAEIIYIFYSIFVLCALSFNLFESYRIEMYFVVLTYIWVFLLTLKYRNFSIYQIFLVTYFVFLLARIFLTCLGMYDFTHLVLYQNVFLPDDLAVETLNVVCVFLIGTSYGWLLFCKDKDTLLYFNKRIKPTNFNLALSWAFYVFIFLLLLKNIRILQIVINYGYVSLFNGEVTSLMSESIIFTGTGIITDFLFSLLLFYNRETGSFVKYSILMIAVAAIRMFTGQRGPAFVLVLYIIYLWSTYYREVKIVNLKSFVPLAVIPIVIQWVQYYRTNFELISINELLAENVYKSMLSGQGVSLEVVSDVILYKEKFVNTVPFLLGYIVDFFKQEPIGQVMEDIVDGNYLGDHLPYIINPQLFFIGCGTGTSIVAEVYELCNGNIILILITAFILTIFVLYVAKNAYRSIYLYTISFYLLRNFIYSPRDSLFKHLNAMALTLLGCLALSFFRRYCMQYKKLNTERLRNHNSMPIVSPDKQTNL